MQAVILAAGRGSRMGELTESTPKPMLMVHGKTLLEHKLDALPHDVDEVIFIVGHYGGVIHDYFGGVYKDKKIFYVEQDVLDGTGGALWRAKDILKDRFIVMMGDDLYSANDITAVQSCDEWCMAVWKTDEIKGGIVNVDAHHHIVSITEGNKTGNGYAGTNLFGLDTRLFEFPLIPKAEGSPEY
ncbi:MAG TPA: nucleotidyltransferase family protein [Candidatus Paceibacterota bacterium]|nr:nucleotidyltransferase family protein [Candidatus Paceibacterota bacterium]